VYTQNANQMFMLKTNGGDGFVNNLTLSNFIGHKNAYSFYIDQAWAQAALAPGPGVNLSSISVKVWFQRLYAACITDIHSTGEEENQTDNLVDQFKSSVHLQCLAQTSP